MSTKGSGNIVVVGSLNADFVVHVGRYPRPGETVPGSRFDQFPGGEGANQAYAVARLARGKRVSMIGQVGADAHAGWLKDNLAKVGVDVSGVATDASVSSGVALISIDETGQNEIIIVAGANGTFSPAALLQYEQLIADADFVLLQLEVPLETVQAAARLARHNGATVLLDPAPARPLPDSLLADVDYLTPNETELRTLDGRIGSLSRGETAAAALRLRQRGVRNVIAKLGAAGALLSGEDGEHLQPGFPVKAVDTTAAGDAFNGAFAVALSDGLSPPEALRFACAAAALSVTRAGAQPSMPSRDEVLALARG